ncbi:YhgE/Pip domain-containing protein [Romboutsia maritimum]|uniref:YhgE/Pip domain-containing protein n=1 Tax=Romboutsia maritimum TaxID=2020948 RepID=A0A371IVW1_9FIRM|nr:YhgE/Pip domain-containing protein [Romboutsia maritimum]RDY24622.1 YhgE/Pip domain-containing protein [Romboutsia maritimum]
MKNIFKIYKKDFKDIFSNYTVLLIIGGLTILPSLYGWFNIKASWDPYGNTGNINVAFVNNDEGAQVFDKNINIGDKLVDKLKDNTSLGWNFVDEKTALKGVENGTYYAYIEIPKTFSKNLTSIATSNIKKGEIIYKVNQKINAIAPKITDKGASTIQLQINQTVSKTVGEILSEVFNELGLKLEQGLPKLVSIENSLVEVQGKFSKIDETVNLVSDINTRLADIIKTIQQDIPSLQKTLANSKNLSSDVKLFLKDTKNSLNKISPIIKEDLLIISNVSSSAHDITQNLIDAINKGSDSASILVDSLYSKLSTLSSMNKTVTDFLYKLDEITMTHPFKGVLSQLQTINTKLDVALNKLNEIASDIENNQKPSINSLNNLLKLFNDVNIISSNILDNFDLKISNPINNIFEESFVVVNNIIDVLKKAEAKLPEVEDILAKSIVLSKKANEGVNYIKENLPIAKSIINDLVNAISKVNDNKEVNDLISLLKNNVTKQSDFLEQPVDLVTESLYPIANYGSAMTPFYTALSLWVGILLLMSLISTEVHGEFKPLEVYFGRGLTVLSLALLQALIASVGCIVLLGVSLKNPILFVLLSLFAGIVFTSIVYSAVSLLGNVGKAFGVILLVIQVAGSGGTFPIEITPEFFQKINPFLPFTYAIGALRETVGGIYQPNLTKDIIVLLIFLIVSIIIATILKAPILKATAKFRAKFKESKLIGH